MLGEQVRKHPDLAARVADARMCLGNHSFSHANLLSMSREEVRGEVHDTQERIARATGQVPRWFRPPYGKMRPSAYR